MWDMVGSLDPAGDVGCGCSVGMGAGPVWAMGCGCSVGQELRFYAQIAEPVQEHT